MSKQAEAIVTPGKGPWEVISETSAYWNVAAKLDGLVAPSQTLSEIAYSPVCRVNKHAPGKAHLAMILALPDLLAACEAAIEVTGGSEVWNGETNRFLKLCEAAVAKARGTTP